MIIYDRNCLFTFLTTAHSIFWLPELRPPVALGKRPGESCRIIQQKPFILNLPSLADTVGKSPQKVSSNLPYNLNFLVLYLFIFLQFLGSEFLDSLISGFLNSQISEFMNSIRTSEVFFLFNCSEMRLFRVNFNNCGFPPEIFH